MEGAIDSLTKTVEEGFNKLKDEVTSERFKEQTDRFIDRFSDEAKNLFCDMREWVKNIDTESIKSKINRKEEPEDILAADLVAQLDNLTVEKPVLDEEGNVIVWPGQIIGKEEIKVALRSGKLQDLLDLATVSLLGDQKDTAAVVDEEEPEIEVEVIVAEPEEDTSTACVTEEAEEDAFILEEAAKMEQAEEAVHTEAAEEPEVKAEKTEE